MRTKRRWTLRVRDSSGQDLMLVIEVPRGRGAVYASLGRAQIEMAPSTVSRLIDMCRDARTLAMQERGDW